MCKKNFLILCLILLSVVPIKRFFRRRYTSNLIIPKSKVIDKTFRESPKIWIFDVDDVLMSRKNVYIQICAYVKFLRCNLTSQQFYKGVLRFFKYLFTQPIHTIRAIRRFEEIKDDQIITHGKCFTKLDGGISFWRRFKQVHADNVLWLIPMIELIKQHQGDYSFNIATNQSQDMVDMWLVSKNNPLKSAGINPTIIFSKNTVRVHKKKIIKKPNPHYFQALMIACKKKYPKINNFIFIDDKRVNVQAAAHQGFIGIVANNAQKVIEGLKELQTKEHN